MEDQLSRNYSAVSTVRTRSSISNSGVRPNPARPAQRFPAPATRGSGRLAANGNSQTQNNFVLADVGNNRGATNAQSLSAQVVQPSQYAIDASRSLLKTKQHLPDAKVAPCWEMEPTRSRRQETRGILGFGHRSFAPIFFEVVEHIDANEVAVQCGITVN